MTIAVEAVLDGERNDVGRENRLGLSAAIGIAAAIARIAPATVRPCSVVTSTGRGWVTISAGLFHDLDIEPYYEWLNASRPS